MNTLLHLLKLNKSILILHLSILSLVWVNSFAQNAEKQAIPKFLIEAGVEYGGDELLEVLFTNGNTQSVRAGQGGFLAIGGELGFEKVKNLMFRATIGFKYNTTAANNANIRLIRYPINVLAYWKIKQDFRLGAGISTHQGVRLRGDGFFPDVNLKSNLGVRFEFGYKWIAITYTTIRYSDETEQSVSASSIGATLSFTIPK
jgi:hypothetical protein